MLAGENIIFMLQPYAETLKRPTFCPCPQWVEGPPLTGWGHIYRKKIYRTWILYNTVESYSLSIT
jgi:hypothetical protein